MPYRAPHPEASALPPHLRVQPQAIPTGVAGARTWARELRCHQWLKNLLVLAVPAGADALGRTAVAGRAALALVVFCLLSSAVYLINDVVDVDEDRHHPVKRHRPIAAGQIGIPEALVAAGGCLVVGLISAALVDFQLLLLALAYAGLNLAYTSWARQVPIVDILAIAGCFLLRALAGGAATGLSISIWFVAVVTLAALFVAASKRYADVIDPAALRSRAVLRAYNAEILRRIGLGACAGALLAYALWSLTGGHADVPVLRVLSLVPFAAALIRYLKLARDGQGGAPEKLFLEDRQIQLAGLLWVMLFLAGA
jgi:decaprenyl-phosphate phosphoribosyltransferase